MKIRIIGGGWYGCHLTAVLLARDHNVQLFEATERLFSGASGNMPARLHLGFHYPRSKLTRTACQTHNKEFMEKIYGELTRPVPINLYAVAEHESLVDFGTYRELMESEEQTMSLDDPSVFGLSHVEGALLTKERHILLDEARAMFERALAGHVVYGERVSRVDDSGWDLTIDCTFCALDSANVDRYEACLTVLLKGPTNKAITIMDGPFPSLYPWNEERGLSSLTSAKLTPIAKCSTWDAARECLDGDGRVRAEAMLDQMAYYYPRVRDEYEIADCLFAIRAMPRSAADARLIDVVRVGERAIRIRAGKLDAIFAAERAVLKIVREIGE